MAFRDVLKRAARLGRRPNAPPRETAIYAKLVGLNRKDKKPLPKPTPRNLRAFANTVYARTAINAIKNPIAMLNWEITPVHGIDVNSELQRQIDAATASFTSPNNDDSFRSFVEQVLEDMLVLGAGATEQQIGGDATRPLWLFPVDGASIQIYPAWSGKPDEPRYAQTFGANAWGGGGTTIPLRNDELIYIRPNPTTHSPFGLGPLETAFTTISRILGVGEHAGNVSTNARPSILLTLGEDATSDDIQKFRAYWRTEVEGQGTTPIVHGKGVDTVQLHPEGDNALYLKYQEFLKREVAVAFGLAPMNLGVEKDVNRNTAEVGEDRDWVTAIRPMADLLQSYFTREALQGKLGFSQLEFKFIGLDREDEDLNSQIHARYYEINVMTPNDIRARMGLEPSDNPICDKYAAEVEQDAAEAMSKLKDNAGVLPRNKPVPSKHPR